MTLEPQEEYDLYDVSDLEQNFPDEAPTAPPDISEQRETDETPKVDRKGWLSRLLHRH